MPTATVRSVTVRMNADVGGYIRDMKAAGAATDSAFDRASKGLLSTNRELETTDKRLTAVSGSASKASTSVTGMTRDTTGLSRSVTGLDRDLDGLDRRTKSVDTSINQLTGRLRLVADLTAILGPGLAPIAAVGVPALAGLNAQLTSAVLAGTAFGVAMVGVPDAIKAVAAYDLDPTAANLEAAQAALSQLGPDALAFVGAFREFRPVLGDIRDATAAGIFPGLIESLGNLEDLAPTAARLLRDVGQAAGDAAADSTASLASDRWTGFFDYLRDQAPQSIANTTRTLGDLGHGVAELIMSLDPGADRFESWIGRVADGFDDWASSDQGRRDVEALLDYAATTGPAAEDALIGFVDALTQVVQAGAPLGGPVLEGLTAGLNVVSDIANSDLGTPLIAAASGLALYNRALRVTDALSSTAFGTRLSTWTKDTKASIPTLGQWGTTLYRAGQSAQYADERTLAARASVGGFLRQVGPGVATVGALGLATTGLGDKLGVTNTASLALIGTMAGPWGAAAGAAAGAILDLRAANDDLESSIRASQDAIQTGTLDQMRAAYDQLQTSIAGASWINDLTGDTAAAEAELAALERAIAGVEAGSVSGGGALASLLGPASGVGRQLQIAAQSMEEFAASFDGLNNALDRSGSLLNYEEALDDLTASIKENGNAWNAGTAAGQANLRARNNLVAQAIERSQVLKEQGDALGAQRILTRAIGDLREFGNASPQARRAMQFLIAELRDLNNQKAKPKVEVDSKPAQARLAAVRSLMRQFDLTRAEATALLNTGPFDSKMNGAKGKVRDLDRERPTPTAGMNDNPFAAMYGNVKGRLGDLDRSSATPTINARDNASGTIASVKSSLSSIDRSVDIFINTYRRTFGGKPNADGGFHENGVMAFADGGYGEDGHYYSRTPQIVRGGANILWGEESTGWEAYISGKPGMRERNLDVLSLAAGRLGVEVVTRADGGTGPGDRGGGSLERSRPGNNGDVARASRDAGRGLRSLTERLKDAERAVDAERKQRERLTQARSQLSSTSRDLFRSELFGGDVWSETADTFAQLRADIAGGREYQDLIRRLRRNGLDGDALAAAASTVEGARYLAGLGKRQLQQFEDLYDRRDRVSAQAGRLAGNAAYGDDLRKQTRELKQANRRLASLERAVKRADDGNREGHAGSGQRTARALDGGANKARKRSSGQGGRSL